MSKPHEELAADLRECPWHVGGHLQMEEIAKWLHARSWRKATVVCSAHQNFEDSTCKTCFPGEPRPVVVTEATREVLRSMKNRARNESGWILVMPEEIECLEAALAQQHESER